MDRRSARGWLRRAALALTPLAFLSVAAAQSLPQGTGQSARLAVAAPPNGPAALPDDPSIRLVAEDPAGTDAEGIVSSVNPDTALGSEGSSSSSIAASDSTPGSLDPEPAQETTGGGALQPAATPRVAPIYMKYIPPGYTVQHLTANDKVVLGIRDLYNPLNFAGMFASAGYEQLTNGEPNYGTDRGAFGERLGAAGIRESTQGLFTDSVFSPLLHEDPRYYIKGPQYGFIHRTFYAITRPLVTRTDGGRTTINGALLLGYAASSALSYGFYPQDNQNPKDTAATFGAGLGGAALGFFVTEFSGDVLQLLHIHKQPIPRAQP